MQTLLLFLPALFVPACVWVSDEEVSDLKPFVDDDGDGVVNGDDCEPADAAVSPTAVDAPYDGLDTNCDGANDNDVDKDGYDGVEGGGGDCNDNDSRINPGQNDPFYDGVDQDCDGVDEYDADGDGFRSASHADTSGVYGDDCYDDPGDEFVNPSGLSPEAVFPGALETWYDGTDQDCSGDLDYDQDGDGFECLEGVDESGGCEADCDDQDAGANPGAEEIWYDGIDEDCDAADDDDADADGTPSPLDCDDFAAGVHPYAPEVIGDGIDGDCDQGGAPEGDDTVRLRGLSEAAGWVWTNPQSPVFATGGSYVVLGVATDAVELLEGGDAASDGTVGVYWSKTEASEEDLDTSFVYAAKLLRLSASTSNVTGITVGAAHQIVTEGNLLYDVLAVQDGSSPSFFLSEVVTLGAISATSESVTGTGTAWNDLAALSSGGFLQLVGCSSANDTLTYASYDYGGGIDTYLSATGYGFTVCAAWLQGSELHVFGVSGGVMGEYTVEEADDGTLLVTPLDTDLPYAPTDIDLDPEAATQVLVIADGTGTGKVVIRDEDGTVTLVGVGRAPQRVAMVEDALGTRYVGFVTAGGEAWLGYETGGSFSEVKLTPPGTGGFAAEDVAITLVDDMLLYAVTGRYTAGGDEVAVGQIRF